MQGLQYQNNDLDLSISGVPEVNEHTSWFVLFVLVFVEGNLYLYDSPFGSAIGLVYA